MLRMVNRKNQEVDSQWVCVLACCAGMGLPSHAGFTDPALYTGEIEYNSVPEGEAGYWILPVTSMSLIFAHRYALTHFRHDAE